MHIACTRLLWGFFFILSRSGSKSQAYISKLVNEYHVPLVPLAPALVLDECLPG
jgi:hypothetical protein